MSTYRTLNHSKFLLSYHIIFVCKYRRKLLIPYGDEMKAIMFDIADSSDFDIKEIETDVDHVHLLIESVPKLSPLQIVRKLKQASTYRIWKLHPELKHEFNKGKKVFWSRCYLSASVSEGVDNYTNTAYIQNQESK
jgi:putative transposase